jgi:hypothetical protein
VECTSISQSTFACVEAELCFFQSVYLGPVILSIKVLETDKKVVKLDSFLQQLNYYYTSIDYGSSSSSSSSSISSSVCLIVFEITPLDASSFFATANYLTIKRVIFFAKKTTKSHKTKRKFALYGNCNNWPHIIKYICKN